MNKQSALSFLVILFCLSYSHATPICGDLFVAERHLDTLKRYVYDIESLVKFPEISKDISFKDLKKLAPGHYKLSGSPTSQFIKNMVHWGLGSTESANESGLQSVRGLWILTLAKGLATPMANDLQPVAREGLISFDLHTHPVDVDYALMPSFSDFRAIERTVQRRIYIASPTGISIVSEHQEGSWFNPLESFRKWAKDNNRPLESETYTKNGWRQDFILFLKQNGILEFVPWSDTVRIRKVLDEGNYDPLQDRHFNHNPDRSSIWSGMPKEVKVGPLRVLDWPFDGAEH